MNPPTPIDAAPIDAAPIDAAPIDADCVVVTSHTDRGNDPLVDLAGAFEVLRERHPAVLFLSATLDGSATTITQALDQAAAAGARRILLVSGQTLPDRPVTAWFRRIVGHWLRTLETGDRPQVAFAASLTHTAGFADLIDEAMTGPATPASDRTSPLASPLWDRTPAFARHVLVCRGPRCSAQGGGETWQALVGRLYETGLDNGEVLATQSSCMFTCGRSPVIAVYPDDVWYAQITADDVEQLVYEHLINDRPLPGRQCPRRSR